MTTAHNFGKHSSHVLNLSTRITTAKIVNFMQKKMATNGWSKGKSRSQMQKSNNDISTRIHNKSSLPNNNRMTNYYLFGLWLHLVFISLLVFHSFFFVARIVCARRFRVIINREVSHIELNLHLLSVKQAAVAMKIWLCANCNSGSTAATTTQK